MSQGVRDLDRAVTFYRDVLEVPFVARYGGLAFFDLGGVRLLLEASPDAATSILYLEVDDICAARAALEAQGVAFVDEPHAIFTDTEGTFGPAGEAEWMSFFRDSEGNLLALSSREPPEA